MRILLQRVGPFYRFIHRSLQEHFAGLSAADVDTLCGEMGSISEIEPI